MNAQPLVEMHGISKRFGEIQALDRADFQAWRGGIHIILGENGAGKTSLMSVLAGLYQPDAGEVRIDGRPVTLRSPLDALRLGVAVVHQHAELIGNMTVWENIVLGNETSRWYVNHRRHRELVGSLAGELGWDLPYDARVQDLEAGLQQKVEILRSLYHEVEILILDEPTTFLTPQETDELFATIRALAQRGMTVILVTHKLRDALRIGDWLTVMRAGRVVATLPAGEASEEQLVRHLMGQSHEVGLLERRQPEMDLLGEGWVLEIRGLTTRAEAGAVALQDVNLSLRRGEIHGIAGVAGNGQRELIGAIVGTAAMAAGSIVYNGRDIRPWSIAARHDAGISLIPEDRLREGILPDMALWETLVLGLHRTMMRPFPFPVEQGRSLGSSAVAEYQIKAPHALIQTAKLSGGNIQKVLVARVGLASQRHGSPLVLAVNPTRGLDLRTVGQVHRRLESIARQGGAVIFISEDLDELMSVCHRISVVYRGRLAAQFEGPAYDRYAIGDAMLGNHPGEPVP